MEFTFEKIKNQGYSELEIDCTKLRKYFIEFFRRNGGHVGSNLGIIELLVSTLKEFDYNSNDFVFDIGHQTYLIKLLNFGDEKLNTIRKYGGISGFMNKFENEKDIYISGHAGTGLSMSIGLLQAYSMSNEITRNVICFIGDGTLSEGLCFEALNNLIETPNSRLILILNDNNYAIEDNVGALSRILKDQEKAMSFFKLFNLDYYYCSNGHDLSSLEKSFVDVKKGTKNCILHVQTHKGFGYDAAEGDIRKLHYAFPQEINKGEADTNSNRIRFVDVNSIALIDIAQMNKDVIVITPAMRGGNGLDNFHSRFPEKFIDVGMCEQHCLCIANGLSIGGKIPIICLHSAFLPRAYDQLIQDICLPNIHSVILIARSGLSGPDGPTHHGLYDLTYLRCVPNLMLFSPKSGEEYYGLIHYAANCIDGPVAIVTPHADISFSMSKIPPIETLYSPIDLVCEGEDLLLITVGTCFNHVLSIKQKLPNDLSCGLVHIRLIKPFDEEIVRTIMKRYKRVAVIEENSSIGGLGSEISKISAEDQSLPPVKVFGIRDKFITHGDIPSLREVSGIGLDELLNFYQMRYDIDEQ